MAIGEGAIFSLPFPTTNPSLSRSRLAFCDWNSSFRRPVASDMTCLTGQRSLSTSTQYWLMSSGRALARLVSTSWCDSSNRRPANVNEIVVIVALPCASA
ncbi:hypothetical protein BW730_04000 [Tessaracoccus aquimaris]|uniref:Uncharacterized protein n=1 Tax=Tessaracoccus aquimaris TaxID=1332264 RepID=A0A1Q2CL64_9ACTN|nr:hypothetical protein BW730_04000 [Tessaracoccus aquimaris]